MAIDKKAFLEYVRKLAKEFVKEAEEKHVYESWSVKAFEDMHMKDYDADMPVKHGLFRMFLDFLGYMFKGIRGNIVLHDLGDCDGNAVLLINTMPQFEVKYFDTHIFSFTQSNGLVRSYILLRGEGVYGLEGDETVESEDLFDLTGYLSQVMDEAMNDMSENGVQNKVIKKYVDGQIQEVMACLTQSDWNENNAVSLAFIRNKPIALTWRPAVDAGGNLSWTASVDDRTLPVSQNIKGSKGEQGVKGDKGDRGEDGIPGVKGDKGDQGENGASGTNGVNGLTPEIGENENWWIGGSDTGKPSRGTMPSTDDFLIKKGETVQYVNPPVVFGKPISAPIGSPENELSDVVDSSVFADNNTIYFLNKNIGRTVNLILGSMGAKNGDYVGVFVCKPYGNFNADLKVTAGVGNNIIYEGSEHPDVTLGVADYWYTFVHIAGKWHMRVMIDHVNI